MVTAENPDITARKRAEAIDAMRAADGRPSTPSPPVGTQAGRAPPPLGAEPREMIPRTLIGSLQEMAARDAKDYADFIQLLRDFAAQRRADLESFERLLGIK